jgi:hypothetical protein
LLVGFRSEVPAPDEETAERIYRRATMPQPRSRASLLSRLSRRPQLARRRLVLLAPAVAVTVAVVAVAVLAAPWRHSPLATERALAALGEQPVVHAIVEQASPRETVIDLASGRERLESSRSEYWYDDERDVLRVRLSMGGHRPLRFRFSSTAAPGRTSPWSQAPRVVEIETIPRDSDDFQVPQRGEPRPAEQTGIDEGELKPAEAAAALGRPVFWPGEAVEGVELNQIELMRITTRWTDGHATEGHALEFHTAPINGQHT